MSIRMALICAVLCAAAECRNVSLVAARRGGPGAPGDSCVYGSSVENAVVCDSERYCGLGFTCCKDQYGNPACCPVNVECGSPDCGSAFYGVACPVSGFVCTVSGDTCCTYMGGSPWCCSQSWACSTSVPNQCIPPGDQECPESDGGDPACCMEGDVCCAPNCCSYGQPCCQGNCCEEDQQCVDGQCQSSPSFLAKYSAQRFNRLDWYEGVRELAIAENADARRVIEQMLDTLHKHGSAANVGVALLHKHFELNLDEHEFVLEGLQCAWPAEQLSSGPSSICNSVSTVVRANKEEEVVPHMFALQMINGSVILQPLEFARVSDFPGIRAPLSDLVHSKSQPMLRELWNIVERAEWTNVFGIGLLHRDAVRAGDSHGRLVETSDMQTRRLLVRPFDAQDPAEISRFRQRQSQHLATNTMWTYEADRHPNRNKNHANSTDCNSHCTAHCGIRKSASLSPHLHESYHRFAWQIAERAVPCTNTLKSFCILLPRFASSLFCPITKR